MVLVVFACGQGRTRVNRSPLLYLETICKTTSSCDCRTVRNASRSRSTGTEQRGGASAAPACIWNTCNCFSQSKAYSLAVNDPPLKEALELGLAAAVLLWGRDKEGDSGRACLSAQKLAASRPNLARPCCHCRQAQRGAAAKALSQVWARRSCLATALPPRSRTACISHTVLLLIHVHHPPAAACHWRPARGPPWPPPQRCR